MSRPPTIPLAHLIAPPDAARRYPALDGRMQGQPEMRAAFVVVMAALVVPSWGCQATARPAAGGSPGIDAEGCTIAAPAPAAEWRRALHRDRGLAGGAGALVVRVDSSLSRRPVPDAIVAVYDTSRVEPQLRRADRSGGAVIRPVRAGAVPLRVSRLGHSIWRDTVLVRGGFQDTLRLGLGVPRLCPIPTPRDFARSSDTLAGAPSNVSLKPTARPASLLPAW